MNGSFTIVRKEIIISGTEIQIHYGGAIKTQLDYDSMVVSTMNYLTAEGFLIEHPIFETRRVFDFQGKEILREDCAAR